MATTFGGLTLHVMTDARDGTWAGWEPNRTVVREAYAMAGDSVQILGDRDSTRLLNIEVALADEAALVAAVGTVATLTINDVSQGSCFLESISQVRYEVEDIVSARALFTRPV
jgi:hypothetical protein